MEGLFKSLKSGLEYNYPELDLSNNEFLQEKLKQYDDLVGKINTLPKLYKNQIHVFHVKYFNYVLYIDNCGKLEILTYFYYQEAEDEFKTNDDFISYLLYTQQEVTHLYMHLNNNQKQRILSYLKEIRKKVGALI